MKMSHNKPTAPQIKELWDMIADGEEAKIAAKFANSAIPFGELMACADIAIAMVAAIKKITEGAVANKNYKGYVMTAGMNAAKKYLDKRYDERKRIIDIDGVAKNEHGEYIITEIADNTTDAEQMAVDKIDAAEKKNNKSDDIAVISRRKKDSVKNIIRQALNMGLNTKREVLDYLKSEGVRFNSEMTVAATMSHIRRETKKDNKHGKALNKARRLFDNDAQITRADFLDKMGDICSTRSKKVYYAQMKRSLVREKPCSANRA